MKGDKIECNNYRGISLLTSYKSSSNLLLSTMTPYGKKIIAWCQCGLKRNRSIIDHIPVFSIWEIFENKLEYNKLCFLVFKNVCDSIKKSFYDIIVIKLVYQKFSKITQNIFRWI